MSRITATYRLQLHKDFGFDAALALTDHLAWLGISHAYASPYLCAEPGSTHGYNLVDPTRLNPEIGTDEQYVAWTKALAARGMGHIVDVVPNHMAASSQNRWWLDVLENGPSSLYADHFDIEWHPPKDALENKVLLPILGAQYGEILEKGELTLERDGGTFWIRYWERRLPVNPRTLGPLLEGAVSSLELPSDDPRRQELESIVTALRNLPTRTETDPEKRAERAREKEVQKRRLATLCEAPEVAAAVDAQVARINGRAGDPASFDALDDLLLQQAYRLAYWRVATEEINYRRFFDINDLAAVRMEESAVFDDTHALLLRLVAEGRIQGIRLDHTDGLYDPEQYFEKLRAALDGKDVYVVAEKILSAGEELARDWHVDGTTGYDSLVQVSGLFVERRAEQAFTKIYRELAEDLRTFGEHALDGKRAIMRSSLSSELHMLAVRLERVAMRDRRSRDFTLATLRRALSETIAAFPVYRTYVRPDGSRTKTDEQIVHRAIRAAKRRNPEVSPSVFDFLRDVLLLAPHSGGEEDHRARVEVAMRFQQLTGPVTAKGVEDTAFYTYVRFVALNEVGGTPDRFGTTTEEFHAANQARLLAWPRTMTASSTHDTKRGEDVRARLAVLSEMPAVWEAWVKEWSEIARRHVTANPAEDEDAAPTAAERYLFFQTVLGAYPLADRAAFAERIAAYMIKAAREAKQRTSWLATNDAHEQALTAFVQGMLSDEAFAKSLADKAEAIARHGASNGLAQTLIRIASPGIPDTYQGSEAWDLRLVDPDNRGLVDYAALRELTRRIEGASPRELLQSFEDGRIKLHVLRAALALRRAHPDIFLEGAYEPLEAGPSAIAFARTHGTGTIVCAATCRPRTITRGEAEWATGDVWREQAIAVPPGAWRDVLTGRDHAVEDAGLPATQLFSELPVALLTKA
jgi:(1->4)-alpha-D-glucan 1-alpha-D-glucosylmutase